MECTVDSCRAAPRLPGGVAGKKALQVLGMLAFGLLASGLSGTSHAQSPKPSLTLAGTPPLRVAMRGSASTRFDPAIHGFRFVNSFANNVIPEFDYRTDGLCGGMVFSALDYFRNPGIPRPVQDYAPGEGAPLRTYLYHRQTNSIVDHNHVKWVELSVNPGGARNDEFYRWGLEGPNGRLDELKRRIDRGEPVPLGLKSCGRGCSGDHQVLAIGYDVGNFTGDLSQDHRQVRIHLYDPNRPGVTTTLTPDPERRQFVVAGDSTRRWQTWFIVAYSPRTPPRIVVPSRELIVELGTGGDDLRGGNDNVHLVVMRKDGREHRLDNANMRRRWINHSDNTISVSLPDGYTRDQLRGVRLETTFGGGMGGDNWNLDAIKVRYRDAATDDVVLRRTSGSPLVRFTGDHKRQEFLF